MSSDDTAPSSMPRGGSARSQRTIGSQANLGGRSSRNLGEHKGDGGSLINVEMLEKLKRAFDAADQDGGGDLDMEEFVSTFSNVLGSKNLSKQQLTHLFMKIDANSDGGVDWDEFTSFMLTETAGATALAEDRLPSFVTSKAPALAPDSHRDMIEGILFLPDANPPRFVTCSRDGTLNLYQQSNLTLLRSVTVGSGNAWVVAMELLPLSHTVAVASMDRAITFYDSTSFEATSRIKDSKTHKIMSGSPLCLATCATPGGGQDEEILAVGDDKGTVTLFKFQLSEEATKNQAADRAWHICDGSGELGCAHLEPRVVNAEVVYVHELHTDWVTALLWCEPVALLASSSTDGTVHFLDVLKPEERSGHRVFREHTKAVYAVAFSAAFKFMASCGQDRDVFLWDPYTLKVIERLKGHSTTVTCLHVNDANHMLLSVDTHKTIRVWDTRNFKCVQVLHDTHAYRPENVITSLLYDDQMRRLVTCSNRVAVWKTRKQARHKVAVSHESAVCAALYNEQFEQVCTVDQGTDERGSVLSVWDVNTGAQVFSFDVGCNVTAMCFDRSGRRIVTGGHDGSLKIWNFSSGQVLLEFRERPASAALTAVAYVDTAEFSSAHNNKVPPKYVVGAGWSRKITIWEEDVDKAVTTTPAYTMPNEEADGDCEHRHEEDILCMALCNSYLVTGDFSGQILAWHFASGRLHARLVSPRVQRKCERRQHARSLRVKTASNAAECLVYIPGRSLGVLVAGFSDGFLQLWDVREGALLDEMHCGHAMNEGVTALCHMSDTLVVGDTAGCVRTWDTSAVMEPPHVLRPRRFWQAHKESVTSLQGAKHDLLVTGGGDGFVRLWTLEGLLVGMFDATKSSPWDIRSSKTWASTEAHGMPAPEPSSVDDDDDDDDDDDAEEPPEQDDGQAEEAYNEHEKKAAAKAYEDAKQRRMARVGQRRRRRRGGAGGPPGDQGGRRIRGVMSRAERRQARETAAEDNLLEVASALLIEPVPSARYRETHTQVKPVLRPHRIAMVPFENKTPAPETDGWVEKHAEEVYTRESVAYQRARRGQAQSPSASPPPPPQQQRQEKDKK